MVKLGNGIGLCICQKKIATTANSRLDEIADFQLTERFVFTKKHYLDRANLVRLNPQLTVTGDTLAVIVIM
jgi:hypothetical protein